MLSPNVILQVSRDNGPGPLIDYNFILPHKSLRNLSRSINGVPIGEGIEAADNGDLTSHDKAVEILDGWGR